MDIPYFYITESPAAGTQIALKEDTSKHCIQVLRMKAGEPLILTNGLGALYHATITREDKRNCLVSIDKAEHTNASPRKVTMGISLLKNANRLEWFLEKATELGIAAIVPLICHRTEKQYFRQDRMNNIVISAMLQSKQTFLPVLSEPVSFETFIQKHCSQQNFIAHCIEADKQTLNQFQLGNELSILIGPEGDFTPDEITLALQNNYQPISLGNTRLRTETAGIVAATLAVNL